jgi:hypothetical protein
MPTSARRYRARRTAWTAATLLIIDLSCLAALVWT